MCNVYHIAYCLGEGGEEGGREGEKSGTQNYTKMNVENYLHMELKKIKILLKKKQEESNLSFVPFKFLLTLLKKVYTTSQVPLLIMIFWV